MVGDDAARRRAGCPARSAPPYLPRRPQASPLYRVLADHFETLERVHEERFEPTHGPLRRAARVAVGRFLDCGLLEHGFARVRCSICRAEFLVAFRCCQELETIQSFSGRVGRRAAGLVLIGCSGSPSICR